MGLTLNAGNSRSSSLESPSTSVTEQLLLYGSLNVSILARSVLDRLLRCEVMRPVRLSIGRARGCSLKTVVIWMIVISRLRYPN